MAEIYKDRVSVTNSKGTIKAGFHDQIKFKGFLIPG